MVEQRKGGSKIVEVSFANGKLYKKGIVEDNKTIYSIRETDNCVSNYHHDPKSNFLDFLYPTFSTKEYEDGRTEIKYYHPSNDIYKHILEKSTNKGVDFSKYDLCPNVELWIGVATYKNDKNIFELFFTVENDKQLKDISEYYNLKYPLPKGESLEVDENHWHSKDFGYACERINPNCNSKYIADFKLGSIKFKFNKPTDFKMYKSNYKENK